MAERQWYYTADNQQQGPVAESELKRLFAVGQISANTYVWSDGMTDWRLAAEIPGLLTSLAAPPAFTPLPGGTLQNNPLGGMQNGAKEGHFSSIFGVWPLLGHSLLYVLGVIFVIPAPWAATAFYNWIIPHIQIPGWPNLSFTGKVGDIWWAFVGLGLCIYINQYLQTQQHIWFLTFLIDIGQWALGWLVLRWIVANVASNGQQLPLRFEGGIAPYIGWQLFVLVAFISIVGWAWVLTAMMRWICRNIVGTQREILFTATGWEVLWRTFVFGITSFFIIPIPWMLAWYVRWFVSQFAVQPGTA
jgi:hypothetical protein